MKKATLKAYTKDGNGKRTEKPDAYRVTGYAQNDRVEGGPSNDTSQIRLEGSFQVADLGPVPDDVYENDSGWCAQRLQHRIYYDVSISKPVTFRMTVKDGDKTYVVMKDGQPYDITVDVELSSSFDFWDPANTCPGVKAIYPKEWWLRGEIPNNGGWNQSTGLDGGPGMDFRLDGEQDKHNPAIQVTKYVQGDYGNGAVQTLMLQQGTDCLINVYQSNKKLHDKVLKVGTDGVGMFYDYDIDGGTHENPAKANISEVANSVADEVVDAEGNVWTYDRSRVETEYVWMDNNHSKRHIGNEQGKDVAEFFGVEEIVGEYRSNHYPAVVNHDNRECDGNEFNRFLEFYVYNIYKPKEYPVYIKKVDSTNNSNTLSGAEFDLYGPYDALRSADTADATRGRKYTKVNTNSTIAVDGNGIGDLGNLKSGIYYLYETKAPDGFNMLTEPVVITVSSANEATSSGPVSYVQTLNGSPTNLSGNGGVVTSAASTESVTVYTLTIQNTPGARLPSTGGVGTTMFYVAGGLITLLALALLITKRRAD